MKGTARVRLALVVLAAVWLGAAGCAYKVVEDGRINRDAVERLVSTVAELRGLPPTRPLKVALESPAALSQRAQRDSRDPEHRAELTRRRAVWSKLGLIEGSSDLVEAYGRLTTEAPFGYYDTDDQTLRVVARSMMRSEIFELISAVRGRDVVAGEILAHEVCHALQDMHYGLDALDRAAPSDDARQAMRGLVEGDASLVGFLYSATFFQDFGDWVRFLERRVARALAIEGVPAYLNARAMFPYLAGGLFVARLYERGGFAAVNAAYAAPPPSSEVLLHPALYGTAAGVPRALALPAVEQVSGAGATVLAEDVLGEHGLRYVIARNAPGVDAVAAADGWGGDRYRVTREPGGELGLLWATRWDSAEDGAQFCAAYRALIAHSYVGTRTRAEGTAVRYLLGERLVAAVDCAGDAVDIVETLAPEQISTALAALVAARTPANPAAPAPTSAPASSPASQATSTSALPASAPASEVAP